MSQVQLGNLWFVLSCLSCWTFPRRGIKCNRFDRICMVAMITRVSAYLPSSANVRTCAWPRWRVGAPHKQLFWKIKSIECAPTSNSGCVFNPKINMSIACRLGSPSPWSSVFFKHPAVPTSEYHVFCGGFQSPRGSPVHHGGYIIIYHSHIRDTSRGFLSHRGTPKSLSILMMCSPINHPF